MNCRPQKLWYPGLLDSEQCIGDIVKLEQQKIQINLESIFLQFTIGILILF